MEGAAWRGGRGPRASPSQAHVDPDLRRVMPARTQEAEEWICGLESQFGQVLLSCTNGNTAEPRWGAPGGRQPRAGLRSLPEKPAGRSPTPSRAPGGQENLPLHPILPREQSSSTLMPCPSPARSGVQPQHVPSRAPTPCRPQGRIPDSQHSWGKGERKKAGGFLRGEEIWLLKHPERGKKK